MIVREIIQPLYEELVSLLHDSFQERLLQGLNFACAYYTVDDFISHLSENAIIFGAFDDNNLCGIVVLNNILSRKGIRYANHEYLAVASYAKNKGIGTLLFKELKKKAIDLKLDFILSDTADRAESSIKYHKRNGFKIFGQSHYKNRNYNSINFMLPLTTRGYILSIFPFNRILRKKFSIKK